MGVAHDGGAGAASGRQARRPLSRPLARPTAPPHGGARALKGCAIVVLCGDAEPSGAREPPANDRCRDASVVSAATDARPWVGVSPPIAAGPLHCRLRMSPCKTVWGGRRRSARDDMGDGVGLRAIRLAQGPGVRSAPFHQLRRLAAHRFGARSNHPNRQASNSRTPQLGFRPPPPGGGVARCYARRRGGRGMLQTVVLSPQSSRLRAMTAPPHRGARAFVFKGRSR